MLPVLHSWSRSGAKYLLMSTFGFRDAGFGHSQTNYDPIKGRGDMVFFDFEAEPFRLEAPMARYFEHPNCPIKAPQEAREACRNKRPQERAACLRESCTQQSYTEAMALWELPLKVSTAPDDRGRGYFDFGMWHLQ